MKKVVESKKTNFKKISLTILAVIIIVLVIGPLAFSMFDGNKVGNVALIPIEGVITTSGGSYLGDSTVSSKEVVNYIKDAEESELVQVIMLEINSPGGSAVASDEIAIAVKKVQKPVIAVIREAGASGGYWIASSTDYIIANKMSTTGSIGVISSYLEFSGLMQDYGVGYERLVAGENKDMGTPFRKLTDKEKIILQGKLDKIHQFFIEEIAENRNMSIMDVKNLATGEFYLGIEAYQLGLVDALGTRDTAEEYIKKTYGLEEIDYVVYQKEVSFFELLSGVFSNWSFSVGEGIGSTLVKSQNSILI
ncbi:signal peptide peptidase SppA [Candidatus Woesearchaeota archaeon CG_4_10_14_0_2_um_filter_33_13]|nr:MAG: signal peptide peptidase SppA [Candidatus Woesearchaeota archaeon CG_4_10_14_0_2_um_filter_33_13]